MSSPDDEIQAYLAGLSGKVRRKLIGAVETEANGLADAIKAAAPEGPTGDLQESVRVEDGKDDLEKFVVAGGDLTTTEIRGGSGVPYNYALGIEFGTSKMPAQPFFWPTVRVRRAGIEKRLADAVAEAIGD